MPIFNLNKSVETSEPVVAVELDANSPLAPGLYTFQLVVVDDDANVSAPAEVSVRIADPGPTAVITGPAEVGFGQSFELSGQGSSDVAGGQITTYRWTLTDVQES